VFRLIYKKYLRKIIYFIYNISVKEKKVIKCFNNYRLILDLNEHTSWHYYFTRSESEEEKFIKKNIKAKSNSIDVGANLGFYTLLFASLSPVGNIFAFEPSTKNYNKLIDNINLNQKKNNIHPYKIGLSNYEGSQNLIDTSDINEGGYYLDNPKSIFFEGGGGGGGEF